MAYERYIARMKLRGSEADDTFPERHVLDPPPDPKPQSDAQDEDLRPDAATKPPRRRPRRRSESIEGYEMRDRYWEAMDIIDGDLREAAKAPAVWDYVYDPVCLPQSGGAKTPAIRRLGGLPIRRAWRRRNSREPPDLGSTRTVEAIMLYERGTILPQQSRCTHCRQGRGVSPGCIVLEPGGEVQDKSASAGESGTTCSNCLYEGRDGQCDARPPPSGSTQPSRTPTPSQIKGSFASDPIHLEVLDLVDKKLGLKKGEIKEDAIDRAKQIEMAALEIAQAAHEWGLGIREKRRRNICPTHCTN